MPIYEDGMDLDALQPQFLGDGGNFKHRQLETAEVGQGLHRERREGEICLDLNPAEMFVWTKKLLLKMAKLLKVLQEDI